MKYGYPYFTKKQLIELMEAIELDNKKRETKVYFANPKMYQSYIHAMEADIKKRGINITG